MKNTTPIEMLESSLDLSLNHSLQCIQGKIKNGFIYSEEEDVSKSKRVMFLTVKIVA